MSLSQSHRTTTRQAYAESRSFRTSNRHARRVFLAELANSHPVSVNADLYSQRTFSTNPTSHPLTHTSTTRSYLVAAHTHTNSRRMATRPVVTPKSTHLQSPHFYSNLNSTQKPADEFETNRMCIANRTPHALAGKSH